jgi:hypothetical protein
MSDMDATLIHIEASLASDEFKARLFALLARRGLYRVRRDTLQYHRAEAVASLFAQGLSRAEVRDITMERFGVSRRSAYRLQQRSFCPRQERLFE